MPASYPIDPKVLAGIRPMELGDVDSVSAIHAQMMGTTLWGQLGEPFLQEIYKALLAHPSFIAYVYLEQNRVCGFIAGSENGPQMLKQVFRTRFAKLLARTVIGLVRSPFALRSLFETFAYFKVSELPGLKDVCAESMFCAFEKNLRGRRISGAINKVLFDEVAARGHRYLKITCEKENPGAKRQLTNWGFEQMGMFRFYGKEMIAWRLDLEKSDRVDPADRLIISRD
jgi:hypothetical protein